MKKSLNWFLVGVLLAAGSLAMSARAQSNVVYAVEYKQSTNRFGTINLLNGSFTQISSVGAALINDIAYCPTNGMLYGISNTTALVTFNKTNGAISTVAKLSVSGLESLAFRPSDGVLFGASQSTLYTITLASGNAKSVGNFGSPKNLGTTGQNIRFAQDGNLYVSNTSTNTDIYRVNTANGAATWMGEAVGYPYLMLQNASSNMYGVFINLGSGASNATPQLVSLNLSSFVNGGTNANGSTHQVAVTLVGAGTNFPANFNFSGNVPQAVTNLTVPVSASGPSNQTAVVGSNVVFSTTASGTGPYNYVWSKNGAAISGQTSSSLTLNNVTTNGAATYSVIVGGAVGTVTNTATLTVNVPVTVIAAPANQTTVVGGNATFSVTATGTGLSYQWLLNNSVIGTSSSLVLNNVTTGQAGVYTVIVKGAAGNSVTNSATLTVNVPVAVTAAPVNQTAVAGGNATFSVTATGTSLSYQWLFNGSVIGASSSLTLNNVTASQAGIYTVIVNGAVGSATNSATLTVTKAIAAVTLGSLSQTYTGTAKPATATTTPSGLTVSFTYNGSATAPTNAGSYTVIGTINDANYRGSATNTLVISQATGAIALGSLSQTYTGAAKAATATTTPSGLTVSFTYNGSVTVPTSAGSYTVIGTINDANYQGSATNTLVISQASGAIALGSLNQTYNGTAKPATATTTPSGLTVSFTYNGSVTVPTSAGSYTVIGTINDANYRGSATNTLVISQATASITLGSLSQTYTGAAKAATATTIPTGLVVSFTYNGSATVPTSAGSYTVIGTINDVNYQGSATNMLVIAQASGAIALGSLSQTYNGTAKPATATTTPSGLTVGFTYNGSVTVPTAAGSYTVIGTINDANYRGSATNTLVIAQASDDIVFGSLNQTYDGLAKPATATTTPTGLMVNFTYNGSANVPTNAGSYTVIGTINDVNYQGSATSMLVINQAVLTVTAENKNKICGMPNPPLTASYSGFVGGENTNVLSLPVVLNTTATNTSDVGKYPITAGGAAAANYTIQYVNGTLQVFSAPQVAGASVSVNGMQQYVVSYPTIAGQTYQLEYTTDLMSKWTPLGTPFAGTDGIVAVTNNIGATPKCFFRVEVLEGQ